MRQLRVGVVGLGRHHVPACAQAEHVGRLVICDPDTNRLEEIRAEFPRVAADGGDEWDILPTDERPIVTGTFGCVNAFLEAIVTDAPVPVSGREGFASLAVCVAADESAATGRPAVPESADFA